jgi:SAM-dependent methyltransferase
MNGMAKGQNFWDSEYENSKHFSLSDAPAEDLVKFTRWMERNYGREFLNPTVNVLDLGCGNGRNLIFLSKTYGCRGTGYDISGVAVKQAKTAAGGLPLNFITRTIDGNLEAKDGTYNLVLDMMTSHYLDDEKREELRAEIKRVLKPGGWLLYKTFLLEDDWNAKRMIRENPSGEKNTYVHPTIGIAEHVSTEEEIIKLFEPLFEIHKVEKTGKHIIHGKPGKRRSIIVYMRKTF